MADKTGTKQVEKRLKRLEEALEQSEAKRSKLKKRLKRLEQTVAEVESDLAEALEDLEEEDEGADDEPQTSAPAGVRHLSEPDTSWTVTRLREAATSRGLTGVSRMSKAKLLAALSST